MRTDHQIQQDVINQLAAEPFIDVAQIGVSVKNGIVTLLGTVDSYYKKIKAENAIKNVAGVRGVAEQMQVTISPFYKRTDYDIAQSVLNAMKEHTSIPEDKITVKVEDGMVTLQGEVDWYYQKRLAEQAITGLAGIRQIQNVITVKPITTAVDVKKKISDAIQRNASLDASKIRVEVVGSKVTLRGDVRSLTEKEDAGNAAYSAPGITSVDNLITIHEPEYSFEE